MATTKTGFNYYSVDTDRYADRRIKKLKKSFGCVGLAVYDYLLCEIYRDKGCFSVWDEDTAFDVAEYLGIKESTVEEVVKYCGVVGLFDAAVLSRGILTSKSIQRRYMDMCATARRQICEIPDAVRLIGDNSVMQETSPIIQEESGKMSEECGQMYEECRKNEPKCGNDVGRMAQNVGILPQRKKESKESKESRESNSACAGAHTHEAQPLTPHSQLDSVLLNFEKFCTAYAPTLLQFQEPMTAQQLDWLRKRYNDQLIKECAAQMHNKNANATNRSAFLTMKKWIINVKL